MYIEIEIEYSAGAVLSAIEKPLLLESDGIAKSLRLSTGSV